MKRQEALHVIQQSKVRKMHRNQEGRMFVKNLLSTVEERLLGCAAISGQERCRLRGRNGGGGSPEGGGRGAGWVA